MKRVLFVLFILFCGDYLNAQSSSATAVVVTPDAYWDGTVGVPTFSNVSLLAGSGEVYTTCIGSQSVYWVRFNIPISIRTNSIKVTVSGAAFSPVISLFNSGMTQMQCQSGTILRSNATTATIIPGNDYFVRISSTTLSVGSAFQLGLEYYPAIAEVRNTFTPNPPSDTDGYNICETIRRNNLPSAVSATRWVFTPTTTPNNGPCESIVVGNSTILNINTLPCICYNINFSVQCEIQVDGHWCGLGPALPVNFQPAATTFFTTPNLSTLPLSDVIFCDFACNGSTYEWEFQSSNGATFTTTTAVRQVGLSTVPCLRWNRIYSVRVRVISCGITGPWCGLTGPNSSPLTIITPPMPSIPVPDGSPTAANDFCFASRATNSVVDVPFVEGITQYIFQFTRVQPTAPFLPLAPAKVVITTSSLCPISLGNCTSGNTYRIGIKTGIGIVLPGQTPPASTCVPAQQSSSYSPWCYFSVNPAAPPVPGMTTTNSENEYEAPSEVEVIDIIPSEDPNGLSFEVYGHAQKRYLSIDLNENEMKGSGFVQLYNVNGQEVFGQGLYTTDGATAVQIELPDNLPTGIYFVRVASESNVNTGKIFLSGR